MHIAILTKAIATMRICVFAYDESGDVADLGVCVENDFYLGDNITHIITAGNVESSALYFRIASNEDEYKMPLIGRTLVHDEGNALIEQWINSLNINCN